MPLLRLRLLAFGLTCVCASFSFGLCFSSITGWSCWSDSSILYGPVITYWPWFMPPSMTVCVMSLGPIWTGRTFAFLSS